jgi:hypothetical protein
VTDDPRHRLLNVVVVDAAIGGDGQACSSRRPVAAGTVAAD